MIVFYLVKLINIAAALITLFVILSIAFSYFLDMYNPVRQFVDRIVEPILSPIRRVVPLIGMFDISPIVLLLLVYALQSALVNLLQAL